MRYRRPGMNRVGSSSDGRPMPLPKNRLEVRVEAQQKTIKSLEEDKSRLRQIAITLVDTLEQISEKLPKKVSAEVQKLVESARDELD